MKREFLLFVITAATAYGQTAKAPTFSKDVAPILQKHCQTCHRPGEAGPFSMLTYDETRPWAASIREAVKTRKMPPWFADPHYGKFTNGRNLTTDEINTLTAWVDAKAPEGDRADLPAAVKWEQGWGIGKPDQIFQLPLPYEVPAKGVIEYQHIIVPTGFTEDHW